LNVQLEPKIIEGGSAADDRGTLAFANAFDFVGVKRFYKIVNFSTDTIRAFHGHLKEAKYVYVVQGAAIFAAVRMTDPTSPSKDISPGRWVLSGDKPGILYIPAGYANGFRAVLPGTQIMFFSTCTLEESKGDDYRFPADYWGAHIWQVENR
jgi:dTDP-4-dehydrorhamnose 3,5-epimerase-like enzyme